MNWTDAQSATNIVQPHKHGHAKDFSPVNQWNSLTNNLNDSQPLYENSTSRPFSYIWRQFEQAESNDISEFCNDRYGIGILDLWKGHLESACKPAGTRQIDSTSPEESASNTNTEVSPMAGSIKPAEFAMMCSTVHLDIPENLCNTRNLLLNVEKLPQTPLNDTLDMFLSPGSLTANCQLKSFVHNVDQWGFGAVRWLQSGLANETVTVNQVHHNTTCDAWVESDLYMVSRYDTGNVYHIHQDLLQAFIGLAALDMNVETTDLVFLDSDDRGIAAARSLWNNLFVGKPHNRPAKPIQNIRQVIHDVQRRTSSPVKNVCFQSATFGFHAGVTLFSREKARSTNCKDSIMLKSFVDWVLYQLDLPLNFDPYAIPGPSFGLDSSKLITPPNTERPSVFTTQKTDLSKKPLVITYLSRNPTSQILSEHQDRVIHNEPQFLEQVQRTLELHFEHKKYDRGLVFRRINPADIPTMEEQIAMARESDVVFGPHGAALIYTSYIPPYGGVVELQHFNRRGNYQFANIAALTGPKIYRRITILDPLQNFQIVGIEDLLMEVVDQVMKKMDG
ncbi:hypothetical protein INT43_008698 [Umbelopsis isabellina]|uniref:Glycosyltransferase 61 catalytic domain-containing protein n=1 Tax=Mortierella isabellina TaxID=91625 RepID=A0A8H7UD17_MORIS|nr:hypothetical protein INT43_008698 [Umbelopsis isabellina]